MRSSLLVNQWVTQIACVMGHGRLRQEFQLSEFSKKDNNNDGMINHASIVRDGSRKRLA